MSKKLSDTKFKEDIKDYILVMLGAPTVKIELDQIQLDLCINRTCDIMLKSNKSWSEVSEMVLAQDGALAHVKMVLGRIRSKYGLNTKKGVKTKTNPTRANSPLDGFQLLEEGERQYNNWQLKVFS